MTSIQSNPSSDLLGGNDGPHSVTRRRRWMRRVALLTAAALGSTFGFIGVGPVAASSVGPSITIASDALTNPSQPEITGTAPCDGIWLTLLFLGPDGAVRQYYQHRRVGAGEAWSVIPDPPLTDGEWTVAG